jgi:hypothetical protein
MWWIVFFPQKKEICGRNVLFFTVVEILHTKERLLLSPISIRVSPQVLTMWPSKNLISINQEKLIIKHSQKSIQTLHFKFYLVFKRDSMSHLQESFPNNWNCWFLSMVCDLNHHIQKFGTLPPTCNKLSSKSSAMKGAQHPSNRSTHVKTLPRAHMNCP